MQISLDQARTLCYVVDCGGYTQAATQLHKSHSALIYLIRSMEEQCGFPLFDRGSYRNTLTPRGRRVYLKCLEILGKVDELGQLCGQLEKNWEASLKIVFDGILPFDPFMKLYKSFKTEKVPTVVQTYTDYLEDVEKSFYSLQADLMVSILPIEKNDLKPFYLKPLKSYLVAHKDHPIHQRSSRWTIPELQEFYFLTIRGSSQKLGLSTQEFEKSASFFLSDFSVKKEAIMKKTGFGWLPDHLIATELKNKTLLPVKWERESVQKIQPILYVSNRSSPGTARAMVVELLQNSSVAKA